MARYTVERPMRRVPRWRNPRCTRFAGGGRSDAALARSARSPSGSRQLSTSQDDCMDRCDHENVPYFVVTERLGWPRQRWWHLVTHLFGETQTRLQYEIGPQTPTATCHLQSNEDSNAVCGRGSYSLQCPVGRPGVNSRSGSAATSAKPSAQHAGDGRGAGGRHPRGGAVVAGGQTRRHDLHEGGRRWPFTGFSAGHRRGHDLSRGRRRRAHHRFHPHTSTRKGSGG